MFVLISDIFYYMKPHSVRDYLEIDHIANLTIYPICIVQGASGLNGDF